MLAQLPPAEQAVLLASVDLFTQPAVPGAARAAGAAAARCSTCTASASRIAQLGADPQLGTGELVRMLLAASGFPRLRQTLDQTFRWRTDAIKAGWALSTSGEDSPAHAGAPRDRELLRDAIERVLQRARVPPAAAAGGRPAGHHRRGRAARDDGAGADPAGRCPTDPQWILRPARPPAPTSWPGRRWRPPTRWRVYAVAGASPAQSRVAQVAHRGFHLLSQRGTGERP